MLVPQHWAWIIRTREQSLKSNLATRRIIDLIQRKSIEGLSVSWVYWTAIYNHYKLQPILPARFLYFIVERGSSSTVKKLDQDYLGSSPWMVLLSG